jgi:carboxylesterase type B
MAGVAGTHAESAGTRIRIDTGEVVGKFQLNTAVRTFLGIPFAAPPVGALRWKPPQVAAALADGARRHQLRRAVPAAGPLKNLGVL